MQKPSIPKGTRDFSPSEMTRRNHIFDTIKEVFNSCGYLPIETPAMENLSTLLGKYGEEGDKLLFKILNSGDFKNKILTEELLEFNSGMLASKISEKGLRYDLTVPFARYVVQHQNEILFPFKRYQVQPVWRADRPQKGRYREFFQCDVDVIGSDSLLNEFELVKIIDEVFKRLKIDIVIKVNNRKILAGVVESIDEKARMTIITATIDKLEKIGYKDVLRELADKGISDHAIKDIESILRMKGDNHEKLNRLEKFLEHSVIGTNGVKEIRQLFTYLEADPAHAICEFDITLARGLDYYTGAIFEVKSKDVEMGSICGGGRYDDLTGIFGLEGMSGVGVSFGADRIYDVMLQLNLFQKSSEASSKIMFVNFGEKEVVHILKYLSELRRHNISCELYPDNAKIRKQLSYANNRNISYVGMVGEIEIIKSVITLKNMTTGEQEQLNLNDLIQLLSE
ncbi:MAG TPA: histidine--tRNA ligase [Firmicutes bacterium]|nr:histidine--tRNA ligase [Bacillota bacterium]